MRLYADLESNVVEGSISAALRTVSTKNIIKECDF